MNTADLHLFSSTPSFTTLQNGLSANAADPNSPELLKGNMHLVQNQIADMQQAARNVLSCIQGAYYPGNDPTQTALAISRLKESLAAVAETLRESGVGGLPLDTTKFGTSQTTSPSGDVEMASATTPNSGGAALGMPTEEELLKFTEREISRLFEKLKAQEEGAGIVSNLLAAPNVQS